MLGERERLRDSLNLSGDIGYFVGEWLRKGDSERLGDRMGDINGERGTKSALAPSNVD